jgi:hypothetical protein
MILLSVAGLAMERAMETGHELEYELGHEAGLEPGHCQEGSRLYNRYFDTSVNWAGAVAGERVEGAELDYETARRDYVDHVVACTSAQGMCSRSLV